jgi:hypothetical protein
MFSSFSPRPCVFPFPRGLLQLRCGSISVIGIPRPSNHQHEKAAVTFHVQKSEVDIQLANLPATQLTPKIGYPWMPWIPRFQHNLRGFQWLTWASLMEIRAGWYGYRVHTHMHPFLDEARWSSQTNPGAMHLHTPLRKYLAENCGGFWSCHLPSEAVHDDGEVMVSHKRKQTENGRFSTPGVQVVLELTSWIFAVTEPRIWPVPLKPTSRVYWCSLQDLT